MDPNADIHTGINPTLAEPAPAHEATVGQPAKARGEDQNAHIHNKTVPLQPAQTEEAQVNSELKGKKMSSEAILTDARNERGGSRQFELDWKQDQGLYEDLVRIRNRAKDILATDPDNPILTSLADSAESLLREVQDRADKIQAIRDSNKTYQEYLNDKKLRKTYSDEYRIFTDEKQIIAGLATLEEHQLIAGAGMGRVASSEGVRSISFSYPDKVTLQKAVDAHPVLGKFLKSAGYGALGAVAGAATSGAYNLTGEFVKYYSQHPERFLSDIQDFGIRINQTADAIVSNPVAMAGILGTAATTIAVKFVEGRIGGRENQPPVTVNFEDTDSRVVTKYARSILGESDYAVKLATTEHLRVGIYEKIGLDLSSENTRATIGLSVLEMDPGRQGLSEGQGSVRLNNLRQHFIKEALKGTPYKSLLEVPPRQQLEIILNSYDMARTTFLDSEADEILAPHRNGTKGKELNSDAEKIEGVIAEKKKVDTSKLETDIETKTKEKEEAQALAGIADSSKAELDRLQKEITNAEVTKGQADYRRTRVIARYQTPPTSGGLSEEDTARKTIKGLSDKVEAIETDIHSLENSINGFTQEITALEQENLPFNEELSQLKRRKYESLNDTEKARMAELQREIDKRKSYIKNYESNRALINGQLVEKKSAKQLEEKRLDNAKNDLKTITDEIKNTNTLYEDAEKNLVILRQQKEAILTTLGIPLTTDVRTIAIEIAKIKAKPGEIQTEIDKLRTNLESAGKGEGKLDANTEKLVKALEMAAKLIRSETKDEKVGRGNEVLAEVSKGHVDFTDYRKVLEIFFDPANEEERTLAKALLNRSMMVEVALQRFTENPERLFANKPLSYDQYKNYLTIREEAEAIERQIDSLESQRPDDFESRVSALRKRVDSRREEGYRVLESLYADVMVSLNGNPRKGEEFAYRLIRAVSEKCKVGEPFALTTWTERAQFVEPEEVGISRSNEYGHIQFKPGEFIEGNPISPRQLIYDTPDNYRTRYVDNLGVDHEIGISIRAGITFDRSEAENKPDGIQTNYYVEMTDNLYDMFASTPSTNWPMFVRDKVYDAMGHIKPKEDLKDEKGKYIDLYSVEEQSTVEDMLHSLQLQRGFDSFTNFESFMEASVGGMVLEMPANDRNKWLSKISTGTMRSIGLTGIGGNTFGVKIGDGGNIMVKETGTGTEVGLNDFVLKMEESYRTVKGIPLNVGLTQAQRAEVEKDRRDFLSYLGREAMKALQRF